MNIKTYLSHKYNDDDYIRLCSELLKNISPKNRNLEVQLQFKEYINNCKWIADFKDSENKKVAILSVSINNYSNARTIQKNYVSKLLSNGELSGHDGALVAFHDLVRNNWKLALVIIDYDMTDKGIKVSFKPAKRFSFLVGVGEPSKTYMDQLEPLANSTIPPKYSDLKEAFSVSRVTKDFYLDYCNCYYKLVKHLENCIEFKLEASKLQYEELEKFAITFTKKTLGQIVFLHFLQKKGWLGVPIGSEWGEGDKHYIFNTIKNEKYDNYFNDILEPLFYEALNMKRDGDIYKNVKIPFLNGGLFSPVEQYDWKKTNFNIPNDLWFNDQETGFLDLLNQYNFTIDESDPSEQDIAVDPEMLGKIFESLLDTEERHSKGAHYTPREIVHFMCIEALAYELSKNIAIDYEVIKNYILYGNSLNSLQEIQDRARTIDEHVRNLKIIDPAVGSGAFLVGMLNEIVKLRVNLAELLNKDYDIYKYKKETIQNSLYGVDIEYDAIEIAKLRLWLSLIVDQVVEKSSSPKPLPNLAFQLRVGNSLVDEYQGVKLWDESLFNKKNKPVANKYAEYDLFSVMDFAIVLERLQEAKKLYFAVTEEKEKVTLYKKITDLQMELIKNTLFQKQKYDLFNEVKEMQNNRTKPFFLWKLEFEQVFKKGGFDIVIANPPYVQLQENGGKLAKELEAQGFQTFTRQGDIYCLFYEQAINLLKDKGVFSFITSNKWLRAGYGQKLRGFLAKNSNPLLLVDFGGIKVFESATVDVNILVAEKNKNIGKTRTILIDNSCTEDLSVFVEQKKLYNSFTNDDNWIIINDIENQIKTKIEINGLKLSNWNIRINRGVLTGYNEAFIIDDLIRKQLISEDEKSAEIIRPILRGRDIGRYSYNFANLYLLYIPWHFPLNPSTIQGASLEAESKFKQQYPAVYNHLLKYRNRLSARNQAETGIRYEWYVLQRYGSNYMEDFKKRKLVWTPVNSEYRFTIIPENIYFNNSLFMITGEKLELLCAIMNSTLYKFYLQIMFSNGAYTYGSSNFFSQLPILKNCNREETICELVNILLKSYSEEIYNKLDKIIFEVYNISSNEIDYIYEKLSKN